eukprot:455156-Rhodomonas_salina.4
MADLRHRLTSMLDRDGEVRPEPDSFGQPRGGVAQGYVMLLHCQHHTGLSAIPLDGACENQGDERLLEPTPGTVQCKNVAQERVWTAGFGMRCPCMQNRPAHARTGR